MILLKNKLFLIDVKGSYENEEKLRNTQLIFQAGD